MTTCSDLYNWWHDLQICDFCDEETSDSGQEMYDFMERCTEKPQFEQPPWTKTYGAQAQCLQKRHGHLTRPTRQEANHRANCATIEHEFELKLNLLKARCLVRDNSVRFASKRSKRRKSKREPKRERSVRENPLANQLHWKKSDSTIEIDVNDEPFSEAKPMMACNDVVISRRDGQDVKNAVMKKLTLEILAHLRETLTRKPS